ncbi:MAG: hypothetical protein KBT45_03805 [Bacteroidales bacterium]|nr:hypothetical protein [Candidatus Colimorpha pelethequi]MCQ2287278.1 hypothetical protein [Bacteroidales bacterium]
MDIQQELERQKSLLRNYEDLLVDQEDDASYVARGNGFCDAKYSEDFIDGQIAAIKQRIAALESQAEKQ